MARYSWISSGAGILLLSMNVCNAAATPALSRAAKDFENVCLNARENCIYENVRFESVRSLFMESHIYKILQDEKDIDAYNNLIKAYLTPNLVRGLKSLSVERYERDTGKWVTFLGTKTCKYCSDISASGSTANYSEFLRIDLTQEFVARTDGYVAVGSSVYKNQRLKQRIIVSPPSLFHPKDRSPVYIDSRMKGHHATTSFTEGGIILDLDGKDVPGDVPDYVAVSPVNSWAQVALQYRQREDSLLKSATNLPIFSDGPPGQRLDLVAHQLKAYQIHYDPYAGGAFPSVTPDGVISNKHGDCKALGTLADALLIRSGISVHIIVVNEFSRPPLSFNVPDALWNPLHVLLYLPDMDVYINPTRIAAFNADWKGSADDFQGAIALDMTTGHFVVIH